MDQLFGLSLIVGVVLAVIQTLREGKQTEADRLKEEWRGR